MTWKGSTPSASSRSELDNEVEDRGVLLPVFRHAGQELDHVRRMPEGIEVGTNRQVRVGGFRTRDDVQLPPTGQHELGAAEVLEMGSQAAEGTPGALGDRAELALLS